LVDKKSHNDFRKAETQNMQNCTGGYNIDYCLKWLI